MRVVGTKPNANGHFSEFIREISRIPILTREEEQELGCRIRSGDTEAFQILVISNLRFVVKIAKAYLGMGIALTDLVNEGTLGLMKAAERFDPGRGTRFISYAVWWIRQSIFESLVQLKHPLRITAKLSRAIRRWEKTSLEQGSELSSVRDFEEFSRQFGVRKSILIPLLNLSASRSLDEIVDSNSMLRFSETMRHFHSESPESVLSKRLLLLSLRKAVSELSHAEKKVIILRFGLSDENPRTLQEIGNLMGVSRERIRQIEAKALQKVRCNLKSLKSTFDLRMESIGA